jgi:hypothetical protein
MLRRNKMQILWQGKVSFNAFSPQPFFPLQISFPASRAIPGAVAMHTAGTIYWQGPLHLLCSVFPQMLDKILIFISRTLTSCDF